MFFSDRGTFCLGIGLGCADGDTTMGVWQVIFGSKGKETIRSLKERNFGLGGGGEESNSTPPRAIWMIIAAQKNGK